MSPELNGQNEIVKAEPKQNALTSSFTKLTLRERVMIIALIIIIVVCGLGFFVLIPAMNNLSDLRDEVFELESTRIIYEDQISRLPSALERIEKAKEDYAKYETFFYAPMEPEVLDKTITSLVKSTGMKPQTLTLSELQPENVTMFVPAPLRANVIPTPDDSEAATTGGAQQAEGAPAEDTPAEGEELVEGDPTGEPVSAGGGYIYTYNISVTAEGTRTQLYKMIDKVAAMTSLELMTYNVTEPVKEVVNPGDILVGTPTQSAKPGTVSMTFKMYVYVEGADPSLALDGTGAAQ